nr:MAG TPA: Fe-S oxidoreductase [Caudoviricetes sp.]
MNNILLCDIKPFLGCNLKCSFCHERHRRNRIHETNKIYELNYINNYFNRALKIIKTILSSHDYDLIKLSLMGGELFQDRISDEYIKHYNSFFERLKKEFGKTLQITIVSNLVYRNIDRLIQLTLDHDAYIQTSYDFVGRYTKPWQVETFIKNVYTLREKNIKFNVATVLHKQNIDVLMDTVDNSLKHNFHRMYDDDINMSTVMFYNNCLTSSPLYVEPKLYHKVYYQLIDKYPNLTEFSNMRHRILHHDSINHYRGVIHSLSIVDKKVRFRDLTNRERNYNNKYCLTCPFYTCCSTAGVYKIDTTDQIQYNCFDRLIYQKIYDQLYKSV